MFMCDEALKELLHQCQYGEKANTNKFMLNVRMINLLLFTYNFYVRGY